MLITALKITKLWRAKIKKKEVDFVSACNSWFCWVFREFWVTFALLQK